MREMKDSGIPWIGEIPKDWKIVPFGIFLDNIPNSIVDGPFGSDMKNDEYVDEGVPIIQLGAIRDHGMNFTNMHYITEEKADSLIRHNAYPNDIVIAKMMPAGKACEIPDKFSRYVVSADVIKATISNKYLRKFLVYAFNAYCITQAQYESQGSTRARVNIHKVKRFKIAKPVCLESKLIVDYLDSKCARIDSIRENVEAEIEALKQYKQSVITEAVTKGLDKNVEMKDSGIPWIGKIPENWTVMRTRNIAYISIGLVTTMTANYVGKEEGVPLIRNSNIKCNQISYENMAFLSNKFAIANQNRRLHEGQIVTVHTGDIGTSAIIPKKLDGCLGFATIQSTPNSQFINSKFLCWEYNSTFFKNQCIAYCTGDGRQNLNLYDFINLRVIVPPVHEQLEIASYLDSKCSDIDSIISDKQKQLETLDEYKKSLIYEYVTGKKEVPTV